MENKELKTTEETASKGKKILGSVANAGKKSASFVGNKLAQGVGHVIAGTKKAVETVSAASAKYITLKEYIEYGENRPTIIKVVDDTVDGDKGRKKDKIGWIGEAEGTEVLYLFDSAVEESGLKFVPYPSCDEIYCVHPLDKDCYVNAISLYEIINKEKIAELQDIACQLGAKRCVIELTQINTESESRDKEVGATVETTGADVARFAEATGMVGASKMKSVAKDLNIETSVALSQNDGKTQSDTWNGRVEAEFKGSHFVKEPALRWFRGDNIIEGIIKSRKGLFKNKLQTNTVRLESSSVRGMNKKKAGALDFLISESKLGLQGSMQKSMEKEQNCVFIYTVEF